MGCVKLGLFKKSVLARTPVRLGLLAFTRDFRASDEWETLLKNAGDLMKRMIVGLVALSAISAFAGIGDNVIDAKGKLVDAINASVSFEVTANDLNDRILDTAAYSDRFHREIARQFGKDCIEKSFGSVTELSHFLSQDTLSVDGLLSPILEKCYLE